MDLRISVIDQTLLSDDQLVDAVEYGVAPQVDPDFVCVWGELPVIESVHASLTHPGLDVLGGLTSALIGWVPGHVYSDTVSDRTLPFRSQMVDKLSEGYGQCWVVYTKVWGGSSYVYTFKVLCYSY